MLMKQLLIALTLSLFVCVYVIAQNPCTPIGADRCINAPLINSCQLNGWYSNTNPPGINYTANNDVPQAGWCNGGFTIENNQWFRFIAQDDHLDIEVDVSECASGNGIQMGCYELGDANNCVGEQISCFGAASGQNTSLIFEIDNLIQGEEYLLMIDGWAGDGCPFTFYIVSGIPVLVEVDANPLPICPGVRAEGALNAEITAGGGSSILYGWTTTNGNIVSGEFTTNPIIDQPGDYTFFAYNTSTCCWASKTVTVEYAISSDFPTIEANVIQHLNCSNPTATVSAEGSTEDDEFNFYEYLWSFPNGNPAGEGIILEGLIYPGDYILTIRNISTGCVSDTLITVLEDYSEPEISLLAPPVIDCNSPLLSLSLDAPVGSTFEWTSDVAGFSSNEQAPEVSEPGEYTVIVTGANGCTSSETIMVTEDIAIPLLQVQALTLDCTNPSAPINVINDNMETTYSWTGDNNFSSTDQSPVVDNPGPYTLIATNPNGCSAEYFLEVAEDISQPDIAIELSPALDCNVTELSLNTNSTSQIQSYLWSGPNGFSSNEAAPLIDQAGVYTLEVIDDKGCVNSTMTEIENNLEEPIASLTVNNILSCNVSEVLLESQSNQEITAYTWSDNLGSNNTAIATEAGTYFVTLTGTNGCTAIENIEVFDDYNAPTPNAGQNAVITCSENTARMEATSVTHGVSMETQLVTQQQLLLQQLEPINL